MRKIAIDHTVQSSGIFVGKLKVFWCNERDVILVCFIFQRSHLSNSGTRCNCSHSIRIKHRKGVTDEWTNIPTRSHGRPRYKNYSRVSTNSRWKRVNKKYNTHNYLYHIYIYTIILDKYVYKYVFYNWQESQFSVFEFNMLIFLSKLYSMRELIIGANICTLT